MANVYVVTSGTYSEYAIQGVYSTYEAACGAVSAEAGADGWRVETYELDALARANDHREFGPVFAAKLSQAGEVWRPEPGIYDRPERRHPRLCQVEADWEKAGDQYQTVVTVTSPISFEHAEKVAAEIHQRRLRERAIGLPAK